MSLHDRLYKSATESIGSSFSHSIKSTITNQAKKHHVQPWYNKDPSDSFLFYIYVIFFVLFLLFILKHSLKKIFASNSFAQNLFIKNRDFRKEQPTDERKKSESKIEYHAKTVAERLFQKPFNKIRPDWLNNEVTGHNLEIDLWNEELKLAIEVQGQQHYKYIPFFHKNYETFLCQRYRDVIKKLLLERRQIKLIEIPYNVKPENVEHFIRVRCNELNIKLK